MSTTPIPALAPEQNAIAVTGAVNSEIQTKAIELARTLVLDPKRPETVQAVGAAAQQKSAAVSDQLLANTRNKDTGQAGLLLGTLAVKCKGVDVSRLQPGWRSNMAHLPFVGSLFTKVQAEAESYTGTLAELDKIAGQLNTAAGTILTDVQLLNQLFDQNLVIYNELQVASVALGIKLQELDNGAIPTAKTRAAEGPLQAQELADLNAHRERVDRRKHDLELTAAIRLQEAPSIRIVQTGDLKLADKLKSGVLNTIPIWKDNLALAITLVRQKTAADLMDSVDDTTNALLKSNADVLHSSAVQIAKSANRGVVDIETLKYTQGQLLATIDETQKIADEGVKARESARVELESMRAGLQAKLTAGR